MAVYDINPGKIGVPKAAPVAPKPAAPVAKTPFAATKAGIALNTVTGLPKAALDTGVGIARGLVKDTNAIGRTGLNLEAKVIDKNILHKDAPAPYPDSQVLPKELHPIFGDEPVKTLPTQTKEIADSISKSKFAQKTGLAHLSMPLAVGAVLGQNILDFAPLGGSEDAAVKALAKETDPEVIGGLLRSMGLHPSLADKIAPDIAKASDHAEVKTLLDTGKGLQAMKHADDHLAPPVEPVAPKEPYVINAKGKPLANIKAIIGDVKGFVDPAKHDRIEIQNVGKTKETHTILLKPPVEAAAPAEHLMPHGDAPAVAAPAAPEVPVASEPVQASSAVPQEPAVPVEGAPPVEPGQAVAPPAPNEVPTHGPDNLPFPDAELAPGNKIDPTIEEQFQRRQAGQTPAVAINKLAKGPEAGSWQSLVKGYSKNLPKAAKVHLLDYLGTPEFVLEKLGLQRGAEMLHDAQDLYRVNRKIAINKILTWKGAVEQDGKPHSAIRMFRYANGEARYAKSEMTPKELEVAHEIKAYLKEWADRLHLPEDARIEDYITHIFDKDAHGIPTESQFDDPDLSVIMQNSPAKSVYNPFMEKRTNKPGYKEDIWAALDAYVKRATRKEAMDPALEAITEMAHNLDGDSYQYVTRLTHAINMRPTEWDRLLDNFVMDKVGTKLTTRPTAYVTGKIRSTFYRGTLGLNATSALRNLSQGANTYAKLGEKHTVIGYTKLFTRLITHNLDDLYEHGILDDALIQDKKVGVYKSLLQKADPVLFGLFETAEKINRGAAFYGAMSKAADKKLAPEEAVKYAKRMVRETQFAFGAVDAPVALGGDIAKTLGQMQSFNIKQAEFLTRMVKNGDLAGLTRWSLASLAFVYTIGRAFGMKPIQLVPSIGIGGSPVGNLASGIKGLMSPIQTDRDKAKATLGRTVLSAIPAGVQIGKTVGGLGAFAAGKDTTATGRLRFRVHQTPGNLFRAAVFGKSNLPEAQDYYNKLDASKSGKKSSGVRPL